MTRSEFDTIQNANITDFTEAMQLHLGIADELVGTLREIFGPATWKTTGDHDQFDSLTAVIWDLLDDLHTLITARVDALYEQKKGGESK